MEIALGVEGLLVQVSGFVVASEDGCTLDEQFTWLPWLADRLACLQVNQLCLHAAGYAGWPLVACDAEAWEELRTLLRVGDFSGSTNERCTFVRPEEVDDRDVVLLLPSLHHPG